MKSSSAFRNAYFTLSRSLNPSLNRSLFHFSLPTFAVSLSPSLCLRPENFRSLSATLCSATMAGGEGNAPPSSPSLEKQFESFRVQLDESGSLRERIRAVVMEIESTSRLMHSGLLLVHNSRRTPGKEMSLFCGFLGLSLFNKRFFLLYLKQKSY